MERIPGRMSAEDVDRLMSSQIPLVLQVDGSDGAERSVEGFQAEFGDAVCVVPVTPEDLAGLVTRLRLDCLPSVVLVKRGMVFDRFLGPLPRRLVAARVRAMLDAA